MTEVAEDSRPKHKRFDASRLPASERAQSLVAQVRKELLHYEARFHPRRRARIRIAYGLLGVEPPTGDLYCVPGLEDYREGVKKVFVAQLFSPKELGRKPQGSAKQLPRHSTLREVEGLILRHHQPLRPMFYSGAGMAIQCKEGHILIRCLLVLIERQIVALPVYDCLVVPLSAVEQTRQVMLDCFREIAGVDGLVVVKHKEGE